MYNNIPENIPIQRVLYDVEENLNYISSINKQFQEKFEYIKTNKKIFEERMKVMEEWKHIEYLNEKQRFEEGCIKDFKETLNSLTIKVKFNEFTKVCKKYICQKHANYSVTHVTKWFVHNFNTNHQIFKLVIKYITILLISNNPIEDSSEDSYYSKITDIIKVIFDYITGQVNKFSRSIEGNIYELSILYFLINQVSNNFISMTWDKTFNYIIKEYKQYSGFSKKLLSKNFENIKKIFSDFHQRMLEKSGIPNSRSLINHNQIYKNFFDSNAILKYKKLNEKSQNEFERLSNKFKLFVCSSMKAPDSISKSTETHTEMNARNWFQIKYIPEMHASSKVKDGNVLYEQIDPADHDVLSFDSEPTEFVHQSLMNYKLILNEVSPSELDYSRHQRFKDLLKLKKDKRKEKIQECSNGIHSQYSPYFITDIGKLHQDTTTHFDGKEEEQPKKRPKLEKVDDSVSGTFFKNLTSF